MHADLDREHDRLIQVNIDGHSCHVPHARGVAATARAVDRWKRPVHPTKAHLLGLDRSLTGLHERRPSSGYNRVDPRLIPALSWPYGSTFTSSNANSAVSKSAFDFVGNRRSACPEMATVRNQHWKGCSAPAPRRCLLLPWSHQAVGDPVYQRQFRTVEMAVRFRPFYTPASLTRLGRLVGQLNPRHHSTILLR